MSSVMEVQEYTPELKDEIIAAIKGENEKEAARQIIALFVKAGLSLKIKRYFVPKLCDTFRVLCFIKKGGEAVIINTDGFGFEGMTIQLRILNGDSFARLDELTKNIRAQILNAADCRFCSSKCGDKRYVFTYNGASFIKCQYLCANFRLKVASQEDIASVTALTEREIAYVAPKKAK